MNDYLEPEEVLACLERQVKVNVERMERFTHPTSNIINQCDYAAAQEDITLMFFLGLISAEEMKNRGDEVYARLCAKRSEALDALKNGDSDEG